MFITNTKKSNLLSLTNLIVSLSLVVILLLVYLKNKNFELFATSSTSPTTTKPKSTTTSATTTKASTIPATTIPLLNNDIIQNSALVNFINRFIINKNQQNIYTSTLTDRQNTINNLSEQVINLINPTV